MGAIENGVKVQGQVSSLATTAVAEVADGVWDEAPTGHTAQIALRRVHVGPRDWDNGGATDYWLSAAGNANQVAAAGATNPGGLPGWFWTCTSIALGATAAGDLNSSGDNEPAVLRTDASGDEIVSPICLGGYDNFQRAASILGYTPTKLVVEFFAAFGVASANETTTFIGLAIWNGTDAAAAGGAGCITSNGTNFHLTSDNGSDAGAAINTAFHKWKIQFDATNTEWFIDDVSQGTITTEGDIYPTSFHMRAATTNRISLAWLHIYYE